MARRKTNIARRGNSWRCFFRVNGRQVERSFSDREYGSTKAAKEAAELWFAQSRAKAIRGEFRTTVKIRFRDFATEWLRDYAQGNVKVRTFETYEASLRNHLVPEFGDVYLNEISRKAIDSFIADWSAGGSRYQERVRLAREREAMAAEREDRPPRPVRLGRAPGTISNAITPLGSVSV